MGLETATFINGLVPTNPVSGDTKSQGDDHLRLLKSVLQASFPDLDRAFYMRHNVGATGTTTLTAAHDNNTVYCDASAGGFDLNLPAGLTIGNIWRITVIKGDG